MSDVSISEMTYTMLSLLFLLLGIVLIVSIIMLKANPYDSIAFANVEKLSAAMNQVCAGTSEVSIKFDLPQNSPKLNTLFAILPLWVIRTNGDPNYVLYYESYPPGDAIGWEVYQSMQNRLVTSLPEGFEDKTQSDVNNYVDSVRELWNTQVAQNNAVNLPSKNLEGIVVNNIVLGTGPRSDYYLGEGSTTATGGTTTVGIGPENALAGAFDYGKWQDADDNMQPEDGNNAFLFNSYTTLNSFEKSAIKYEACGDNSLCFKTRSGVYRYSLDQCSDIKNIQMVYDARNRAKLYAGAGIAVGVAIGCIYSGGACTMVAGGVGRAGGWISRFLGWFGLRTVSRVVGGTVITVSAYEAASWVFGAMLSYKVQDFNLASPCSIKEMTIKKAACTEDEGLVDWGLHDVCTNVIRTPLYQYGTDGKLHAAGEHYTCTEKVNDGINPPPSETLGPNDKCLQILVTEKADDFCWTPDAYRPTVWSDTQIISRIFGVNNIRENTAYISSPQASAYVLKYYPTGSLESWKDYVARQISWSWPG